MFIKIFVFITCLFIATNSFAENKSILGIDYLKITKNKIIAEVMLEMELDIIEYYSKGEWAETTEADRIYGLRSLASVLGRDHVSEYNYKMITEVAPNIALKFLNLDKSKHPDLWNFGELVRLKKITADERKLYKALHGKDYDKK